MSHRVLEFPELALVLLVGPASSGKSTFARRHFRPTEVVSSDACRGFVADDAHDQSATKDAFDLLHHWVGLRLRRGRLTVVDATNLRPEDRKGLIALAKAHDVLAVAIVLHAEEKTLLERHAEREDRPFGARVVRSHLRTLKRGLKGIKREGFSHVLHVKQAELETLELRRAPLWNDRRSESGPFDLIGDVHGCYSELCSLLEALGWTVDREACDAHPPEGRRAIFLGDLVDRGPASPEVLHLVMNLVDAERALCILGNHDAKLLKHLRGRRVTVSHGLAETIEQLEGTDEAFMARVEAFLAGLISHYRLDGGALVVAHAGLKDAYQGRASGRVRSFCLYGETTGETDDFGLPVRYDWAREYRGAAHVVYGHTPVPEASWTNRTICLDTGCVFGGEMSALQWPEKTLVSVPAEREWYEPIRPLVPEDPRKGSDLLDIGDVDGRRQIETRFGTRFSVRPGHAAAALEAMSRFTVDPRWLVYLPPTMSPCGTAPASSPVLEHPREAFAYYASMGVMEVVCEEKHMGSRAVVVLCRDPAVGLRRFGVEGLGVVTTRTGRAFFGSDLALEAAVLERAGAAMEGAGLWAELASDWVVLDCELMPWNAKARDLLRNQYAAVGASGTRMLDVGLEWVSKSTGGEALVDRLRARKAAVADYVEAYRRYCWPVEGIEDYTLAPFHVLASEGRVHTDRDHRWHMGLAQRLAAADPKFFGTTRWRSVDLGDEAAVQDATDWWTTHTAEGGEGMVVKPLEWLARGKRGLVQPAVKCRGAEYLRIIYGPEYLLPDQLERLRERSLGRKRTLAHKEFALGMEALYRFVEGEPLYRVHECVFGVLALESEPVDPRL